MPPSSHLLIRVSPRSARALALVIAAIVLFALAPTAQADVLSRIADPFRRALESGNLALALGLVFVAGIATSLTPCVYPMIVITVSVFGARQAKTRTEGAILSSVFVLGIATLFTPLGILAALTGGLFGGSLGSPWVQGGLAVLFTGLALGMLGAFELTLPASLRNRLAEVGGLGMKGAFALGLVSAVIAAPCTGPVLAVLLAWVGTSGNVAFGAASLFVYALGLGLLFWVVGTFAIALPKSGRWVEWVKSVFGGAMLVMALYYVRAYWVPAERRLDWLLGAGALGGLGIAVGAIHLSYHDSSWTTRVRKTLGIACVVLGSLGAIGYAEGLPPGAKIPWQSDYRAARQRARAEARPLIVDFGADWCGACKEMDRETLSDPRVVAEVQQFVPVRIDLTEPSGPREAILRSYGAAGLPLLVLHDRHGTEVARLEAFADVDELLALLELAE